MLVDVVQMRVKGEKLSAERLKAARVVRGRLSINSRLDRVERANVIYAALTFGPRIDLVLPVLDHLRITRLRGDGFVLIGFEEVELPSRMVDTYPQSWWCRLVRDPPPLDEADQEDELYALSDFATV